MAEVRVKIECRFEFRVFDAIFPRDELTCHGACAPEDDWLCDQVSDAEDTDNFEELKMGLLVASKHFRSAALCNARSSASVCIEYSSLVMFFFIILNHDDSEERN